MSREHERSFPLEIIHATAAHFSSGVFLEVLTISPFNVADAVLTFLSYFLVIGNNEEVGEKGIASSDAIQKLFLHKQPDSPKVVLRLHTS